MLSKKEVKDIQSLGQKKFREDLKLFIAEGPKNVAELIKLIPHQVEKVYANSSWIKDNPQSLKHVQVVAITDEELGRISQLKTPNQVVATIKFFETKLPDAETFILYLDAIQDPGNFGTIIRIADWFNIQNIVCSEGCADVYNPKTVQATMASIASVNVYYDEQNKWLKQQTVPVFAAALDGLSVYDHQKTGKGILIIGNESKGISKELLQLATEKITIPKKGHAESLNAAVATAIILSHLLS